MDYGRLSRAVETVVEMDYHSKLLEDHTPVKVYVDEAYREIVAIYPEEMPDGTLVLVIEVGR